MTLYFLGTGTSQGIPVIGCQEPVCHSLDSKDKRLRSSVWIYDKNFSVVIDCGPDFRQQMLQSGCTKIDGILFTHEHADHTAGLDDIRPIFFTQGEINIYAENRVLTNLEKRFDYIFDDENKYPGAPSVLKNSIDENTIFSIKDKNIQPIRAIHANLPILGYRIGDISYFTDVKTISKVEIEKIKGSKILIINALQNHEHHSHFNLQEALEFIHLVQPQYAYLTHISHHLGFHETVQKQLPENVFLAYDNLQITL